MFRSSWGMLSYESIISDVTEGTMWEECIERIWNEKKLLLRHFNQGSVGSSKSREGIV